MLVGINMDKKGDRRRTVRVSLRVCLRCRTDFSYFIQKFFNVIIGYTRKDVSNK